MPATLHERYHQSHIHFQQEERANGFTSNRHFSGGKNSDTGHKPYEYTHTFDNFVPLVKFEVMMQQQAAYTKLVLEAQVFLT